MHLQLDKGYTLTKGCSSVRLFDTSICTLLYGLENDRGALASCYSTVDAEYATILPYAYYEMPYVCIYSQISKSRNCGDYFYKFELPEVQINLHFV